MKNINSTVVLIYLYLFCGLVGYLGASDKAHTQIVYLGFLNFISIYYIYNKEEKIFKIFGDQIKKLPVFIFFIFFCWSLLAMIPALNIQESLIQNANYFIQLISFIVLLYLFSKVKNLSTIVKSLIIG
ncbi:hypothetical protein OAW53_02660, partial [Flavobacteriaceae bacterium]|nr:hypothetical protein [Flavobacteriaceae bacterium]